MINNGRPSIDRPQFPAPGGRPSGRRIAAASPGPGRPGPRPGDVRFESSSRPIFSKPTIIVSLALHLGMLAFLAFGLPSCQEQSQGPAGPPVMMVQIMPEAPPAPPPPPAPEPTPADQPQPKAPPAFELPLGDSTRNLQRSGTAENPQEAAPAEPAEEMAALGLKPPAPKLEKRKEKAPEVKPPPVRDRYQLPKPREQDFSKVPQALYRTLGRDAGAANFGSRQGRRTDPVVSRYFELALAKFNENWSVPKGLNPRLQVALAISIEPSGRISSVRLVQSSGMPEFDRSVEQAIRMASPLPPLPPVFGGQRVNQTFAFTPENLGRRRP